MSLLKILFGKAPKNVEVLDATAFTKAISTQKVQLVDVRTAQEYSVGHLEGAKNIDFFQKASFKTKFEELDKSKPVYIYCKSGGRSGNASHILADIGFTKIYDLKGGYLGLS